MESRIFIDETARLDDANIEEVYKKCFYWLKKIRATILIENYPVYLHAFHRKGIAPGFESNLSSWHPKDWSKYFNIRLQDVDGDITLRITIESKGKLITQAAFEKRRRWWPHYVEELFNYVGAMVDLAYRQYLYPESNLKQMRTDIWLSFGFPLLISLLIIVYSVYLIFTRDSIGIFFLIFGLITPLRVLYEGFLLQKLSRDLYHANSI